jgi:hypothetical protein
VSLGCEDFVAGVAAAVLVGNEFGSMGRFVGIEEGGIDFDTVVEVVLLGQKGVASVVAVEFGRMGNTLVVEFEEVVVVDEVGIEIVAVAAEIDFVAGCTSVAAAAAAAVLVAAAAGAEEDSSVAVEDNAATAFYFLLWCSALQG